MPTPDRQVLAKLLADSDTLARETLSDPSPEHAAPMLRSWSQVVQAAARLWAALPPAPQPATGAVDVMAQLAGIASGIGRSVAGSSWPGPGRLDERLIAIRDNLTEAAASTRHGDLTRAPNAHLAEEYAHRGVVHLLYVATHGTAVALRSQIAESQLEGRIQPKRQTSQDRATLPAAHAVFDRLIVFEQLAGRYLTEHPRRPLARGEARTPRDG